MLTRVLFALALICGLSGAALAQESQGAGAWAGRPRGHRSGAGEGRNPATAPFQHPGGRLCLGRRPDEGRHGRDHADQRRPGFAQQQRDACRGSRRHFCCKRASAACRPAAGPKAAIAPRSRSRATARPDRAEPTRSRLTRILTTEAHLAGLTGSRLQASRCRTSAGMTDGGCSGPGAAARRRCSKPSIASAFSSVRPISSRPSIRQRLRNGSMSNLITPPSGPLISCASRSTVSAAFAPARGVVDQLVDLGLRQGDGQDAVLEAVVVENVGEARRDDATDAEIEQRPGRVLAARAAAEIFPGDENLRLVVRRLVQHEIGGAACPSRHSAARRTGRWPSPVRLMVLRYCLGMIMSVSTLIIGR